MTKVEDTCGKCFELNSIAPQSMTETNKKQKTSLTFRSLLIDLGTLGTKMSAYVKSYMNVGLT